MFNFIGLDRVISDTFCRFLRICYVLHEIIETHKLEYRSLNGPEKLLSFEQISIVELPDNNPDAQLIQKLGTKST